MQASWPFVGRTVHLERIRLAVATGAGIVVAGESGVGKSRLAAEAASTMSGCSIVRSYGTESSAAIPLSAFAHELPARPPDADGYANLLRWATDRLLERHRAPLLLVVDDAHLLDWPSAALVHHMVRHGNGKVVATVRTGAPTPDAIVSLWKDSLVPRMDLDPFDETGTTQVAEAALAGPMDGAAAARLWQACQGNVLYLRELLQGACANGTLILDGGAWHWRGDLAVSRSLRELVQARIGQVDPGERDVLELVAFGEPIGVRLVAELTGTEAISRVESRGLVVAQPSQRRLDLRMGHPLYREVVRERCGAFRAREIWRSLARVTEAAGGRRREDVLRVAVWRLDSDSVTSVNALMEAGVAAWATIDNVLAARLFQAALDRGAGPAAANPLSFILFHLGRSAEAVDLQRLVPAELRRDEDRADYIRGLAVNLGSGLGEYEKALIAIDEAGSAVTDPGWRQCVLTTKAVVHFFAGWPATALATLAQAGEIGPMGPRAKAESAAIAAWSRAFRAETSRSLAMVHEAFAVEDSWREYAGYIRPALLDARCNAHIFAGELDQAEQATEDGLELAGVWGGWDMALAGFTACRAQVIRLRGDAAGAVHRCRLALARMRGWNTNLPRFLSELAHSAALLGDIEAAQENIARARQRLGPGIGNWALAVEANAPWVTAARGEIEPAVDALLRVAEAAAERELFGYQLFALHDVVRLGAAVRADGALRRLSSTVDTPLARICAQHAEAAVAGDDRALMAVSAAFVDRGMLLHAAEAAAQAAQLCRHAGALSRARAAELRAWALAQECPDVRTPALLRLTAPDLTPRQLQIARLGAAGHSNREIAEQLVVSVRTVENHLATVYQKLGIDGRVKLAELLDPTRWHGGPAQSTYGPRALRT